MANHSHFGKDRSRFGNGFRKLIEQMIQLTGGLGIPREQMPQIPSARLPEFFKFLDRSGVSYSDSTVIADDLKPTQTHVDSEKIGASRAGHAKPVLVSSDYYILDGHHGWASSLGSPIDCIIIHVPIEDLLVLAWDFETTGV